MGVDSMNRHTTAFISVTTDTAHSICMLCTCCLTRVLQRHQQLAAALVYDPATLCAVVLALLLQGITTAIAYQHGMGSSAFALAVALSSIVMYDAAGVRRHAGGDKQDPGFCCSSHSHPAAKPSSSSSSSYILL
jgi:acid phosphatase family membrane protein YuiD